MILINSVHSEFLSIHLSSSTCRTFHRGSRWRPSRSRGRRTCQSATSRSTSGWRGRPWPSSTGIRPVTSENVEAPRRLSLLFNFIFLYVVQKLPYLLNSLGIPSFQEFRWSRHWVTISFLTLVSWVTTPHASFSPRSFFISRTVTLIASWHEICLFYMKAVSCYGLTLHNI